MAFFKVTSLFNTFFITLIAVVLITNSIDLSEAKGRGRGKSHRSSRGRSRSRGPSSSSHSHLSYHPPADHPAPPSVHHTPVNEHVPKLSARRLPSSNSKDSSSSFIHHKGGDQQRPSVPPIGMPRSLFPNPSIGFRPVGPPPVYGAPSGTHGGYKPPPAYSGGHYNHPPAHSQLPSYHRSTGMGEPIYVHPPTYNGAGSQLYVPGQTVIVHPGQSKGSGFEQRLGDSNAILNRAINGPNHHWYGSGYHHGHSSDSTLTGTNYSGGSRNDSNNDNTNSLNNPSDVPMNNNDYKPSPMYLEDYNNDLAMNNSPSHSQPSNSDETMLDMIEKSRSLTERLEAAFKSSDFFDILDEIINNSDFSSDSNSGRSHTSRTSSSTDSSSVSVSKSTDTHSTTSPPPEEIPLNFYIPEGELLNLTEKLFARNEMNINEQTYILNLQKKVLNTSNVTDKAPLPLLRIVDKSLFAHPTITILRDMYDNFEFNSSKKETTTKNTRKEESLLIDTILNTDVMALAMKWLQEKYYVGLNDFEVKDTLKNLWFNKIEGHTSGFERIFMSEWYPGPNVIGGQNWIYFEYMENQKKIDYLSYVDKVDIGNNISLLKMNIDIAEAVGSNVTMLVGTSPELEMALYTVCFYARPNHLCPISLGGVTFNIYTHSYHYFGKDLIDLGFIVF